VPSCAAARGPFGSVRRRPRLTMTRQLGCNLSFAAQKCLSVRTDIQPDGTYEFLISALAGPNTERHLHGYASLSSQGLVLWAGARLKDNVGVHLGPGIRLGSGSTHEVGRVTISATTDGPKCVLKQVVDGEWFETSASTMGGNIRRTEVALPGSSGARGGEYSISFFDARSSGPAPSSEHVVIPFSERLPFGIVFSRVASY